MVLTRITQPVRYPDGDKAKWLNDGTDAVYSTVRIKFNENGIPLQQVLDLQQEDMSATLSGAADGVKEIPTERTITLCVSWPGKVFKKKLPSTIDVPVGASHITLGELARHAAELVQTTYEDLQQEHGAEAPNLEEDSQSERPVSFKRLVLMSLDLISTEDQPELQWWQVALALTEN